jgi:hypothetical protein
VLREPDAKARRGSIPGLALFNEKTVSLRWFWGCRTIL